LMAEVRLGTIESCHGDQIGEQHMGAVYHGFEHETMDEKVRRFLKREPTERYLAMTQSAEFILAAGRPKPEHDDRKPYTRIQVLERP